jgi:hypothetical protein
MGYGSGMGSRVVCLGRGNVGHACSGQAEQKRYIINLGGICILGHDGICGEKWKGLPKDVKNLLTIFNFL